MISYIKKKEKKSKYRALNFEIHWFLRYMEIIKELAYDRIRGYGENSGLLFAILKFRSPEVLWSHLCYYARKY